MTAIRGVFGAVDELGNAYRNQAEDVRAQVFQALGGTPGILEGFAMSVVAGNMQVSFAAGRALIEESGVDLTGDDRGYYVFATDATVVPFDAASVSDRKDAVVFAWVDPQYGALGTDVTEAGPQIVVVKGVSGSTVARTDAEISAAVGPGGWFRYADVLIDSADTEINPANITLTYPDATDRVGQVRYGVKSANQTIATGTSWTDCTDLDVEVTAGSTYHVEIRLALQSAADGFQQFRFTHPGGTIHTWGIGETSSSPAVTGDGRWEADPNTTFSPTNALTFGSDGSDYAPVFLTAIYVCTTSGTLQLQYSVSGGGSNGLLAIGSHMRVERIS